MSFSEDANDSDGPRAILWAMLISTGAALALSLSATRLRLRGDEFGPLFALLGASAGLVPLRHRLTAEWMRRLVDTFEALGLFFGLCLIGCVASYVLAASTDHFVDPLLARLDSALGFDWAAIYGVTARSTVLQTIGRWSYSSIFLSPVAVLLALCLTGRGARARQFILAYTLALALTLLLFAVAPARGPLNYFGLDSGVYRPVSYGQHIGIVEALRVGALDEIFVGKLEGLVSFPSFHAATAAMLIWAAMTVPWLRWPTLLLNMAMICSTPIEGDHYFVDLIGGMLIAVAAIKLSVAPWPRVALRIAGLRAPGSAVQGVG